MSQGQEIKDLSSSKGTWIKAELDMPMQLMMLTQRHAQASALLQLLLSKVGSNNAVVISLQNLEVLLDASRNTVLKAIEVLKEGNWIEVVRLAGTGSVNAYVLNERVLWKSDYHAPKATTFTATVIALDEDQIDHENSGSSAPIKRITKGS